MSTFTSAYVFNWSKVFTDVELKFPPSFDGRIILYPTFENLKDYFSWRQVDCHINNLYNTTFWALVMMGKLTKEEAHNKLKGTLSKHKNEILFSQFEINYNFIEDIYKKGTLIFRKFELKFVGVENLDLNENENLQELADKLLRKDENYLKLLDKYFLKNIFISHEDVIQDKFWKQKHIV